MYFRKLYKYNAYDFNFNEQKDTDEVLQINIISLEVVRCRDFIFTTISNIVVHKS